MAKRSSYPRASDKSIQKIFELTEKEIEIPFTKPSAFPGDQETINRLEGIGRSPIYIPEELSTKEGRYHLAQAYRKLGNLFVPDQYSMQEGNAIENIVPHFGWRGISSTVKALNLDYSADRAIEELIKDGDEGIDENELLLLGLFMKTTQGVYPYTSTWLLNSRSRAGGFANAYFYSYGFLDVRSHLNHGNHDPLLGVRLSSGVTDA